MAWVVSTQDIEELEQSESDPAVVAQTLVSWADESDLQYAGGLSPAELLSQAATRYGRAGDQSTQWHLLERALEADGEPLFDIRAKMIANLLGREKQDEADEQARELRRTGVRSPYSILLLAESYAKAKRPQDALRWYNIGLRQAERDNWSQGPVDHRGVLVRERYHFRRSQSYPLDSYDEEAQMIMAEES